MHRTALVSAALAPVALIGGWTLAATRQPEAYDATRDTISALAAVGAEDRWVMTTGFLVLGGWMLVDTWMVDLFPQTGHIEVVARFERRGPGPV